MPIKIICKNSYLGCDETFSLFDIEEHSLKCLKCPDCKVKCPDCGEEIIENLLLSHAETSCDKGKAAREIA
jgi:hypothetical protein